MSLVLPRRQNSHLLQDAEELDLRKQTQVADLIEKQRAVSRLLEVSLACPDGAGICALFVAEQLGLNQRFRDRAAGNSDKWTVGA